MSATSTGHRSPVASVATDGERKLASVARTSSRAVAVAARHARHGDARAARATTRPCANLRKSVRVGWANGPRAERAVSESATPVHAIGALARPSPRRSRSTAAADRTLLVICCK
jgi:hypothetical protein